MPISTQVEIGKYGINPILLNNIYVYICIFISVPLPYITNQQNCTLYFKRKYVNVALDMKFNRFVKT